MNIGCINCVCEYCYFRKACGYCNDMIACTSNFCRQPQMLDMLHNSNNGDDNNEQEIDS